MKKKIFLVAAALLSTTAFGSSKPSLNSVYLAKCGVTVTLNWEQDSRTEDDVWGAYIGSGKKLGISYNFHHMFVPVVCRNNYVAATNLGPVSGTCGQDEAVVYINEHVDCDQLPA
jgi:hypothetical protein